MNKWVLNESIRRVVDKGVPARPSAVEERLSPDLRKRLESDSQFKARFLAAMDSLYGVDKGPQ